MWYLQYHIILLPARRKAASCPIHRSHKACTIHRLSVQSVDSCLEQHNLWIERTHGLRITYIHRNTPALVQQSFYTAN